MYIFMASLDIEKPRRCAGDKKINSRFWQGELYAPPPASQILLPEDFFPYHAYCWCQIRGFFLFWNNVGFIFFFFFLREIGSIFKSGLLKLICFPGVFCFFEKFCRWIECLWLWVFARYYLLCSDKGICSGHDSIREVSKEAPSTFLFEISKGFANKFLLGNNSMFFCCNEVAGRFNLDIFNVYSFQ